MLLSEMDLSHKVQFQTWISPDRSVWIQVNIPSLAIIRADLFKIKLTVSPFVSAVAKASLKLVM